MYRNDFIDCSWHSYWSASIRGVDIDTSIFLAATYECATETTTIEECPCNNIVGIEMSAE